VHVPPAGGPARPCVACEGVDHLAIFVRDQERSRGFFERYFGFGARPPRRSADGVLILYDRRGFALVLGPARDPVARPDRMHFGARLPDRDAVSPSGIASPRTASNSWRSAMNLTTSASSAVTRTRTPGSTWFEPSCAPEEAAERVFGLY
jgi:hypothetical protein